MSMHYHVEHRCSKLLHNASGLIISFWLLTFASSIWHAPHDLIILCFTCCLWFTNRLNILQWICTAADKFSSASSSKCFCSKKDKILIKNLRQPKGYTATRFLREFKTKNWTRAQILTILKRTVIQTYNSAK